MKLFNRKIKENTLLYMRGPFFDFGPRVLRCERKEGKVFFGFGFVHSKADNNRIKGKAALRSIHKYLQKFDSHSITILRRMIHFLVQRTSKSVSTDINKRSLRSLLRCSRASFGSLSFGSVTLKMTKAKVLRNMLRKNKNI
jgi:hypothetical protein